MRENDVTPSNVMDMNTDVTKQIKGRHASPCSDMLQNKSRQFSIASIEILCRIKKYIRINSNLLLNISLVGSQP